MGLTMSGAKIPDAKSVIVRSGEEIGSVTSAAWSPALQKAIALGYLKRPFYEPGLDVEIVARDGRIPATVAKRPLVSVR
jgi:aminomethyltransferase